MEWSRAWTVTCVTKVEGKVGATMQASIRGGGGRFWLSNQ